MAAASPSSASEIDELRGALASKGLVLKDSILARVARSKSLNGLVVPAEAARETVHQTQSEGTLGQKEEEAELGFENELRALMDGQSKADDHEEASAGQELKDEERERKMSV